MKQYFTKQDLIKFDFIKKYFIKKYYITKHSVNKKWTGIRIVIGLCAALGWWGFLYPELVLTPDTVTINIEDEDGNLQPLPDDWAGDDSLYLDLLHAGRDRITFRSRLLMNLNKFWEAFHDREAD